MKPSAKPANKRSVRPCGTLEDLNIFDKAIRARFSFYPSKDELWQKARILGISREVFDKWAESRRWYQVRLAVRKV